MQSLPSWGPFDYKSLHYDNAKNDEQREQITKQTGRCLSEFVVLIANTYHNYTGDKVFPDANEVLETITTPIRLSKTGLARYVINKNHALYSRYHGVILRTTDPSQENFPHYSVLTVPIHPAFSPRAMKPFATRDSPQGFLNFVFALEMNAGRPPTNKFHLHRSRTDHGYTFLDMGHERPARLNIEWLDPHVNIARTVPNIPRKRRQQYAIDQRQVNQKPSHKRLSKRPIPTAQTQRDTNSLFNAIPRLARSHDLRRFLRKDNIRKAITTMFNAIEK